MNVKHFAIGGNAIDAVDEAGRELVSDAYSATSQYAVGDYCIYNDALYVCTTAISSPEAWNSSHWSQTSVDAQLKSLKQSLDSLVTASASGYGLSISFAKLANVKMISIMGKPSEQLNAGTQYNICNIPSGFARSTDVVGRAIANGQKAVTYYDVRGNLYLTPSDNLVTTSTISFTIIYI